MFCSPFNGGVVDLSQLTVETCQSRVGDACSKHSPGINLQAFSTAEGSQLHTNNSIQAKLQAQVQRSQASWQSACEAFELVVPERFWTVLEWQVRLRRSALQNGLATVYLQRKHGIQLKHGAAVTTAGQSWKSSASCRKRGARRSPEMSNGRARSNLVFWK